MGIDWSGRGVRSGAFGQQPADDLLAMLQTALDALPEALLVVVDAEHRVLLARGPLLAVTAAPDDSADHPAVAGLLVATAPLLEKAFAGRAGETILPWGADEVVDVRVGPIRDGSGAVVAAVIVGHDVTARRAVHETLAAQHDALLASQERYRLLAENSSDFVMRSTPDSVIEWVSEGVTDVLGWLPEELVGRSSMEFADPAYLATLRAQTSDVNEGAVVSGRIRVRAKDGSLRWMHRTLRPVRDADGEIVARVSGWHDATPEVEAEERLAASEELFRVAMDTSAIGMALVGRDGEFLRVNPAYCAMVGYDADELAAMRFQDLTHPDDVARGEEDGTRVVRAQADGFRQRKRYLTKSGREIWVDVSVAGVRDPEGAFRHLIVQAVDVSAEVANFEALQRAARDYQTLAENASDVVMRVDSGGIIQWISPSVRSVLGWDPELLTGTPSISLVEHDDRDAVLRLRETVLRDATVGSRIARFRTMWGGTVEMSGTGRPVLDERGQVVGQVIGLRDVTEEMAIRRELAYRASHDALTGVVNRDELLTRLSERLGRDATEHDRLGLVFCDVDELKILNDSWGHARGDAVLVEVARALEGVVRRADVVARLSGDEFVILLDRVTDTDALDLIVEKCREAVASIPRPDGESFMSISVGGILATQNDDASALIDRADRAMMLDKDRGRRERGLRTRGAPWTSPPPGYGVPLPEQAQGEQDSSQPTD
ncbi:MAG: PAS domain S-box protein [Candidatus Nanopelagicales bacterium]